jgi:hypothetical protein
VETLPAIFDTDLQMYRAVSDDDITRLTQSLAEVITAHSDTMDTAAQITRMVNELVWNHVQATMHQSLNGHQLSN